MRYYSPRTMIPVIWTAQTGTYNVVSYRVRAKRQIIEPFTIIYNTTKQDPLIEVNFSAICNEYRNGRYNDIELVCPLWLHSSWLFIIKSDEQKKMQLFQWYGIKVQVRRPQQQIMFKCRTTVSNKQLYLYTQLIMTSFHPVC